MALEGMNGDPELLSANSDEIPAAGVGWLNSRLAFVTMDIDAKER
jgi:hypothetical protein